MKNKIATIVLLFSLVISNLAANSLIGFGTVQGDDFFKGKLTLYPELSFENVYLGLKCDVFTEEDEQYMNKAFLHHFEIGDDSFYIKAAPLESVTIGKGLLIENFRSYYYGVDLREENIGFKANVDLHNFKANYFNTLHGISAYEAKVDVEIDKLALQIGGSQIKDVAYYETAYGSVGYKDILTVYHERLINNDLLEGQLDGVILGPREINLYYEKMKYKNGFIPKKYDAIYYLVGTIYYGISPAKNEGVITETGVGVNLEDIALKIFKREDEFNSYGMHLLFPLSRWLYIEYQYLKPSVVYDSGVVGDISVQFLRTILITEKSAQLVLEMSKINITEDSWAGEVEYSIAL